MLKTQIANGQIPGVPGRDYPINSLSGLRKKFTNLQPAPAELITPDFPGLDKIKKSNGRK